MAIADPRARAARCRPDWPALLRALVALGLLAFVLTMRPEPAEQAQEQPDPALAAVLAALASDALDDEARKAAELVGPGAAGDTCFMRYAGLPFTTPRDRREAFGRAALMQDPDRKLALLEDLARTGAPHERWRAWIGQAMILLRSGDPEAAASKLAKAAAVPDMPPPCRADEAWLAALAAPEAADRVQALTRAFDLDRGSWNIAAALALDLVRPAPNGLSCEAAAALVIRSVVQLSHLTRSDAQLARLSRLLQAGEAPPASRQDVLTRVLTGLIAERSGQADLARRIYAEGAARATQAQGCGSALPAFFRSRLDALPQGDAP